MPADKLCENFVEFAHAFSENYEKCLSDGYFFNVCDIFGFDRQETWNSSIICWLLDKHGTHGLKNNLAKQLFQLIEEKAVKQQHLPNCSCVDTDYTVKKEQFYGNQDNDSDNRLDIEIDGDNHRPLLSEAVCG